jgi:NADH-quinone oxidoreductase subunit H
MNAGLLYIIAIGGLGPLAILMAGWSSNNKYALLGAFRAVAMLITYEIPMVIALIAIAAVAGSMSIADIVAAQSSMWYVVSLPLVAIIFFFTGVAEVGRSPFDLIEAESEIVAGFHTEYSGIKFGMIMIGEYVHMFGLAILSAVLFFGGWQIPFIDVAALPGPIGPLLGFISLAIKTFVFIFIMMWFRGTLPRFRIDHLLDFGWKFLVPLSIVLLIGVVIVVKLFSPLDSAYPGPLAGLGVAGEIGALLLVNVVVAALTLFIVSRLARRSRSSAFRAVTAVEPAPTPASSK